MTPDLPACLDAAQAHLEAAGLTVMDRSWSLNGTVIDLVAADGPELVAVRVLTGAARLERKRALRLAALTWAAQRTLLFSSARVCALEVSRESGSLVVTEMKGRQR